MAQALLIVDIQNDYFPGGRMELAGAEQAAENARKVLEHFRANGLPVIHIQHIALQPTATFFLPGTAGAEIHPSVKPLAGETVFQKHYPSAFRDTPLLENLKAQGITELVVVGMMTHMCVDTTVRAAFDLGFKCTVIHDACATRTLSFAEVSVPPEQVHASYIAALGAVFAQPRSAQEWIAAQ
ncbi:MAG TPA: cysteine hydrolase family protein [Terriglobales bacterium]